MGLDLKKKRRKATKKSETKDFVSYVENLENIYDLNFTEQVRLIGGWYVSIYKKECYSINRFFTSQR